MGTFRAFGIAIGILAEVAGVVLLVPPAYFLIRYCTESDSPARHELLLGFGLAIIPPTVALGVAAIFAALGRRALSRTSLLCMLIPGIIMALVTTAFLLVPMTIALFQKTN
jgi:hypothetical protein